MASKNTRSRSSARRSTLFQNTACSIASPCSAERSRVSPAGPARQGLPTAPPAAGPAAAGAWQASFEPGCSSRLHGHRQERRQMRFGQLLLGDPRRDRGRDPEPFPRGLDQMRDAEVEDRLDLDGTGAARHLDAVPPAAIEVTLKPASFGRMILPLVTKTPPECAVRVSVPETRPLATSTPATMAGVRDGATPILSARDAASVTRRSRCPTAWHDGNTLVARAGMTMRYCRQLVRQRGTFEADRALAMCARQCREWSGRVA